MEIEITPPEQFHFETEIPVRVDDINYGGHLSNDAVLRLAHEARLRILSAANWTESNIGGVGIIMKGAAIEFIAQGFYGDHLVVKSAFADVQRFGFRLIHQIEREKDKTIIARLDTSFLCFSYEEQKIRSVPNELKKMIPQN